jgi:hypothetical protein
MNLNEMIYETLKEVQKEVQTIRENQIGQGFDIKENKENLAEHIRRTEICETRLTALEKFHMGFIYFSKVVAAIGTLAGATYAILQVINFLK